MITLWMEGYLATGMEGIPAKAMHCGDYEAATLPEAVEMYKKTLEPSSRRFFSADNAAFWGCRFYDNEADARKAFG